eukprot:gene2520-7584_t
MSGADPPAGAAAGAGGKPLLTTMQLRLAARAQQRDDEAADRRAALQNYAHYFDHCGWEQGTVEYTVNNTAKVGDTPATRIAAVHKLGTLAAIIVQNGTKKGGSLLKFKGDYGRASLLYHTDHLNQQQPTAADVASVADHCHSLFSNVCKNAAAGRGTAGGPTAKATRRGAKAKPAASVLAGGVKAEPGIKLEPGEGVPAEGEPGIKLEPGEGAPKPKRRRAPQPAAAAAAAAAGEAIVISDATPPPTPPAKRRRQRRAAAAAAAAPPAAASAPRGGTNERIREQLLHQLKVGEETPGEQGERIVRACKTQLAALEASSAAAEADSAAGSAAPDAGSAAPDAGSAAPAKPIRHWTDAERVKAIKDHYAQSAGSADRGPPRFLVEGTPEERADGTC